MKTLQYVGPFKAGETLSVSLDSVYRILQIGIEHPNSIPIGEYQNNSTNIKTIIDIDGQQYYINDCDILEYNGLYQQNMTITFLEDLDAYTVIDLIFKDVDE